MYRKIYFESLEEDPSIPGRPSTEDKGGTGVTGGEKSEWTKIGWPEEQEVWTFHVYWDLWKKTEVTRKNS